MALVRLGARVTARLLFNVQIEGTSNLPVAGGFIVAGLPHRNWVEPFLLLGLLSKQPMWIADRRAVTGSRIRRRAAGLAGGAITVGGARRSSFDEVAQQVSAAVAKQRIVAIFPETGAPAAPPKLRELSAGIGHVAARSRAAVVPVVFGGTAELYLRRRLIVRVLAPLASPAADRASISAFMAELQAQAQSAAVELDRAVESMPARRKPWRWLTGKYPRAGR